MPVNRTKARRNAIIADLNEENETVYPGYAELKAKAAEVGATPGRSTHACTFCCLLL